MQKRSASYFRLIDPRHAETNPVFEVPNAFMAEWYRAKTHGLPLRSELDPTSLPVRIVPHLVVLEPVERNKDFRFRLFGTRQTTAFGRDLTGCRLSELEAENPVAADLLSTYRAVANDLVPRYFVIAYWSEGDVLREAPSAAAPVRSNYGGIHIVACSDWTAGDFGSAIL